MAEVFSPFDLMLYGGFVITAAGEVFLQLCNSLVKGLIQRAADASHPESLAVWDSFFTMSWVAAVGGKVLVGVSRFHIQIGHYSSINYLYSCVQERHIVSGPFCCEFDGGVGLGDFIPWVI